MNIKISILFLHLTSQWLPKTTRLHLSLQSLYLLLWFLSFILRSLLIRYFELLVIVFSRAIVRLHLVFLFWRMERILLPFTIYISIRSINFFTFYLLFLKHLHIHLPIPKHLPLQNLRLFLLITTYYISYRLYQSRKCIYLISYRQLKPFINLPLELLYLIFIFFIHLTTPNRTLHQPSPSTIQQFYVLLWIPRQTRNRVRTLKFELLHLL